MGSNTAGFQSTFHIWSTKKYLNPIVSQVPGLHIYNEKSSSGTLDLETDLYTNAKRKYMTGRRVPWSLSNKKYREALHDFEELLQRECVASVSWRNTQAFQVILSNGVIVCINISCDTPDLERIFIDKTLVKKIPDFVADAIIEDNFTLITFREKSFVLLVNYPNSSLGVDWKEGERLATFEPTYSYLDLPGPSSSKVRRHCICSKDMSLVCVWWTSSNKEIPAWSPSLNAVDTSCNVVWLSLTGISCVYTLDFITEMCTDSGLLDVVFSHVYTNQILTVEQSQCSSTKYLIDSCTYELMGNAVRKVFSTTITAKSKIVCQSRNHIQDKLLLGCENGSLVLWDEYKRSPSVTKASFTPSTITWHPSDMIFLASNKVGDIQVFDIALNCLSLQLLCDTPRDSNYLKLSSYFFTQPHVNLVSWSYDGGGGQAPETIGCCEDIVLVCERGPICALRLELGVCSRGVLGPVQLMCEFIRYGQLKEAVALLNSLNWNYSSNLCFQCLILVSDCIFKLPFNAEREEYLENTLGSFYSPRQPLLEEVIIQYRDDISRIARRFFHYLLRQKRFKKAFLLAVDIGSKDLFMDIHYLALKEGDKELAKVAKKRAFQLHYQEVRTLDGDYSGVLPEEDLETELFLNFDKISIEPTSSSSGSNVRNPVVESGDETRYTTFSLPTGSKSGNKTSSSDEDFLVPNTSSRRQSAFVVDL